MTTGYDPFQHAESLGIDVLHKRLTAGNGRWYPEENAIVLHVGLREAAERSTLAHEIGHASYGHSEVSPKNEKQADRFAAAHLIELDECVNAMRATPDEYKVALELGVTRRILRAFLHLHHHGAE